MRNVYIIAEVGPNHQGSIEVALRYVRKLSSIGVDAVKFQIGIAKEHYSKNSFKPKYQKKNNSSKSIITDANKRLLELNDHIKLFKECKKNKVDYLCSAFDLKSLEFLYKNTKFPYFKIPSGEILSIDTLKFISEKNLPIILSTGMASVDEIKRTIKYLNRKKKKKITLLHCISDYPTDNKNLNLNFIKKLKKIFNYPVGLSDHSTGVLAPIVAVSLGASIIEKHVTFDKKAIGPDHQASLTIKEFKEMIKLIRSTEGALGKEKKILSKGERLNSLAVRKSCVSAKDIKKGEKISKTSICYKRPGTGISPFNFFKFINKRSKKFLSKDTVLKLRDFK